ncbi:MAG: LytR C-terminal domain-containing protein [Gammaproteobacteria bacterium]
MKTSLSLLSLAVMSCMTLGGCALLAPQPGPVASNIETRLRTPSDLDQAREAFVRGNYGIAIRHLELALAQHPASIAALNGLGASYDRLGRHDVALRYYFRALSLAPESPLTLNNLGLSYVLQERGPEALRYLELALAHDPNNVAARANYSRALALPAQVAQPQPAKAFAATTVTGTTVVPMEPPAAPLPPGQVPAETPLAPAQTIRNDTAVAEVRYTQINAPAQAIADPMTSEHELPVSVRIEVSNGNGINGMAARVRTSLQTRGANVVRLTNADSFTYASTRVYYRAGFRAAADALAARLPGMRVDLQESDALADWVDVRLLIGRDMDANAVDGSQGATLAQLSRHDPR